MNKFPKFLLIEGKSNFKMEDFNEGVDGKLASRMRRVNPEQFFTLVKMHLSFELDINPTDNDPATEKAKLKKWGLLNFTRKPKLMNFHQKTEGGTLTLEGISQMKQLIEYLLKESCISQEGIFRRTGKLTRQQELKLSLYQVGFSSQLDNGIYSVHDCASVLKGFLAELPEPLLTELHYPAYCQIAELCYSRSETNDSRLKISIQLLLLLLPSVNRVLLKYLLNLLNKTATFENSNKMNCHTLATLFTPHLMCPRKLSPEALHVNSQILSGLVAFMIKKNYELFEIPPKLATDIRAYWIEQERKLLSPKENNLDETVSDTTDTARTVFSFVDHNLTAKANTTDDTQAALAKLYAHIQAMPESSKKRRLVKQFNKENGRGTPRQVKQVRTKSLGDSIKKHIFQKKALCQKKICTNTGYMMRRSNNQGRSLQFDKPDDELRTNNLNPNNDNPVQPKRFKSSTHNSSTCQLLHERHNKAVLRNSNIYNDDTVNHYRTDESELSGLIDRNYLKKSSEKGNINQDDMPRIENKLEKINRRIRRYNSEPIDIYSSRKIVNELNYSVGLKSQYLSFNSNKLNFEPLTARNSHVQFHTSSLKGVACMSTSPMTKTKFLNVYDAQTSTPSNSLHCDSKGDRLMSLTSDRSISPITRSTTKMTKAMQKSMMTPRSRMPLMMISSTNICNLAILGEDCTQKNRGNRIHSLNFNVAEENKPSISKEPVEMEYFNESDETTCDNILRTKKHVEPPLFHEHSIITVDDDSFATALQPSSISIASRFRKYLLSRSVLTASPVDLSFTSRTGDFEASESDFDILNGSSLSNSLIDCLNGNNPSSDRHGILSASTFSVDNPTEKTDDTILISRKRGTNSEQNAKRTVKNSIKSNVQTDNLLSQMNETHLSESETNSDIFINIYQETSF